MGIIKRLLCLITNHKYGDTRCGCFNGELPTYYWKCTKCQKVVTWPEVYTKIK